MLKSGWCQFLDLDRNLFRLCFHNFGAVELQDSMLEDGFDFLRFNEGRQSKGASHFAYIVLAAYIGFLLNLLFLLLGSNDRQRLTDSGNLDLLWLEAWQCGLNHIFHLVLGLVNVDREGARSQELEARPDKALLKEAIHGIAQRNHRVEWVSQYQCHCLSPSVVEHILERGTRLYFFDFAPMVNIVLSYPGSSFSPCVLAMYRRCCSLHQRQEVHSFLDLQV